jgi:uncharacterized RmlC-like cupin family protein
MSGTSVRATGALARRACSTPSQSPAKNPAQVLVVYAPPYQENPRAVVVHNPAHPQPEPRPPATTAVAPVPVCWEGTEGARVETIVDTATAGAQHLAIYRVVAVAGAHGRARQLENQKRVLYVLEGADQRAFEARAGSLVFVPEGAVWQWRSGRAGSTFFVIDGFAADPLPI